MLRDSVARILLIWETSSDRPLKSYLYGMYAFDLVEINMIERVEKETQYELEINPYDDWTTRTLVHAFDYSGDPIKGTEFLNKTHRDWGKCDIIKRHIQWHSNLYQIEQGNAEMAGDISTSSIFTKDVEMNIFQLHSIVSLIYRLKLARHEVPTTCLSAQF